MDNIFIELSVNKEPYIKRFTNDKIINITGESGSGKSYYAQQYKDNNNYIVIDTDEVFARYSGAKGYNKEFGTFIRKKYPELPSLFDDFDLIYIELENLFQNQKKQNLSLL